MFVTMGNDQTVDSGRAMRVLVVDDSPLIRERLSELISALPVAEVIGVAENAREGFEMTESLSPDFVTLDLHMSGGNGFEYLERVQSSSASPHVAVLTNYFNEQYRKRCLALGAVAFLDKSSQFGELEELISTLRLPPRALRHEGMR